MVGGISGLAFGWRVEALRAPPSPQPSPPAKPGEREPTEGASPFRTCVACHPSPGFAGEWIVEVEVVPRWEQGLGGWHFRAGVWVVG